MKPIKRSVLLLIAFFLIMLLVHAPAIAAHDDFELTYTISPALVGYKGADVSIETRVTNRGTTNITGFKLTVTTLASYSQIWTGTITPGSSRTVSFLVPMAQGDLDIDKLLYVAIENDGDADYSDGTQVRTFQVEGTHDIFEKTWSISPNADTYRVGDTVTISHSFRNLFTANAATGMGSEAMLWKSGSRFYTTGIDNHGIVMPGETVTTSFGYTFGSEDVGHITASYATQYTMMGYPYAESAATLAFDVLPPREMDFRAVLSAAPMEIDAGDEVDFSIEVTNTGEITIASVIVRNAEGGVAATGSPIPIGGTIMPIHTYADIYESTSVSFVVECADAGGHTLLHETNSVYITVREPEESAESSPVPSETPAPAPTTGVPSETAAPTEPTAAIASPIAEPTPGPSTVPLVQPQDNTPLYIIIGMLGAVILAGGVAAAVLLLKKRRTLPKPGGEPEDQ